MDALRCPELGRAQLVVLVEAVRDLLGEDLVGVYLHGSLAMGCFNPKTSDLDLLVVSHRPLEVRAKRRAVETLLALSGRPRPVEVSFLARRDLAPWSYPTPYDLHYSEAWRDRYEADLASGEWRCWSTAERPRDPDLAAHVTVLRARGVCLHGRPISEVFPPVPPQHYLASILADLDWARERLAENPVYAVLNACRIYLYLLEGRVSSKAEAGAWAGGFLSADLRGVAARALALYEGRRQDRPLDAGEVARFLGEVERRIRELLTARGEE